MAGKRRAGQVRRSRAPWLIVGLSVAVATVGVLVPITSGSGDFDRIAELREAEDTGKAVEVKDRRTPTSTLWANPDGTFREDVTASPTRAKVDGEWKPLDLDLVERADGTVGPKASVNSEVLSGGGDADLLTSTIGGVMVATSWPATLPKPVLSGPTATYRDVFAGVDLKMTVTEVGTTQVLVVSDRDAADNPELERVSMPTKVAGGLLRAGEDGGTSLVDGQGVEVASAPRAIMWDSRGTSLDVADRKLAAVPPPSTRAGPTAPAPDDAVFAVKTDVSKSAVTLRPDIDALADADVKFPVYIDPMSSPRAEVWAMVREQAPNTSYYKSTAVQWVGKNGSYLQRLFFKFNIGDLGQATISKARFSARLLGTSSCTVREVNVKKTTGVGSSTTWNNQPSWGTSILDSRSEAVNEPDCNRYGKSLEFDVTDAVEASTNISDGFITLGMRATNETNTSGYMFFDHKVSLSVTYSYKPNTPINLELSDPEASCGEKIGGVKPRLRARLIDVDNENLMHHFQAFTGTSIPAGSSPTPMWEELSYGASSSNDDSDPDSNFTSARRVQNSAGELPNGTYTWRVRAIENSGLGLYGPWSGGCTFTVFDGLVEPPGIAANTKPTVWSLDKTENLQLTTPPNMNPAGGQDLAHYRWSLNSDRRTSLPLLPVTTNGPVTIAVTPKVAGVNVLRVWGFDNYGNASEPLVYTFDTSVGASNYASQYQFDDHTTTGPTDVTADNTIPSAGPLSWSGTPAVGPVWVQRGTYRTQSGTGSPVTGDDWALEFTGSQTTVPAASTAAISTREGFTVSAWVKHPNLGPTTTRTILSQGTAADSNMVLQVSSDCGTTPKRTCYRFGVRTGSGTTSSITYVESTRAVPDAEDAGMVQVIGDMSASFGIRIRVVIDGQIFANTAQLPAAPTGDNNGTETGLVVGAARTASALTTKYTGLIDNVTTKSGPLDDAGAIQLHTADSGRCYQQMNPASTNPLVLASQEGLLCAP